MAKYVFIQNNQEKEDMKWWENCVAILRPRKQQTNIFHARRKKTYERVVIATVLVRVSGHGVLTGRGSTADSSTTNNSAATESKTEGTAAASNEDLSGTITFTIWDNNLNDFIESNDMVGKFQEKYPTSILKSRRSRMTWSTGMP